MAVIGEFLDGVQPGFACGEQDEGGVFQFRMNNVTRSGHADLSKRRRVPLDAHKRIEKFMLQDGDVLFNATNSPDGVGKSLVVRGLDERAVFSNHFLRLRTDNSRLDPDYLARWLHWKFENGVFEAMCRQWVNQATVSRESLLALSIFPPPVEEQRRIAAILDRADALHAKRHQSADLLEELETTAFYKYFASRASQWEVGTLDSLAVTSSGGTPSRTGRGNYGGEIPWVKSGELHDGVVCSTEETITPVGLASSSAKLMPAGTILVAMYGATAGAVAVLAVSAATNQAICSVRPSERLHPAYLVSWLRSQRSVLLAARSGGAQPNLSQGTLRNLRVPIPPMQLQLAYAKQVSEVQVFRRQMKNYARELNQLFNSLQSRAFTGRL